MLTSPQITGIDPFSNQSTFLCEGLSIPRGMFYGGCFYTAQSYQAPLHISYINRRNGAYLSTWGVADATGKELAAIFFTADSLVGNIVGLDSQYAGCLKARRDNYSNARISDNTGDLNVFLQGLGKDYTLNSDTLVWSIECCSILAPNVAEGPSIAGIELPADCVLTPDVTGAYYMAPNGAAAGVTSLQRLYIGGHCLSGAHISILPYCEHALGVSGGRVTQAEHPSAGALLGTAEDTLGAIVDGAIVITTHRGYPQE